jgi:hypothetical protein
MGTQANNITTDLLFLVDTTDDAYISCCRVSDIHVDAADEKQKKVLEGIYKSQLVNILGELHNGSLEREGTVLENSKKIIGDKTQELVVDIRLGRVDRRMLIQYPANGKDNFVVLIAACRRGDFDRLQDKFREAFTSVKAGQ